MTGDEIRAARELRGFTQEQVAERLNVNVKTVNNWENDRSSPKNRAAALYALLAPPSTDPVPLTKASDAELLSELMQRALRRESEERDRSSAANKPAGPMKLSDRRGKNARGAADRDFPYAAEHDPYPIADHFVGRSTDDDAGSSERE